MVMVLVYFMCLPMPFVYLAFVLLADAQPFGIPGSLAVFVVSLTRIMFDLGQPGGPKGPNNLGICLLLLMGTVVWTAIYLAVPRLFVWMVIG